MPSSCFVSRPYEVNAKLNEAARLVLRSNRALSKESAGKDGLIEASFFTISVSDASPVRGRRRLARIAPFLSRDRCVPIVHETRFVAADVTRYIYANGRC